MAERTIKLFRARCLMTILMTMSAVYSTVTAMGDCETRNAICMFNGRLRGTVLLREKQGFGCSGFGNDQGLSLDIDVEGFDPEDRVTAYNFRVKSFAGMVPNCSGMDPDFRQDSGTSDLGTYAKNGVDSIQESDVVVQDGSTLWGDNSVLGRSVAVTVGGSDAFQQPKADVLDCCIIGTVNLQSPQGVNDAPAFPNRLDKGAGDFNSFNSNSFPGSSSSPGTSFEDQPAVVRPFSRPSGSSETSAKGSSADGRPFAGSSGSSLGDPSADGRSFPGAGSSPFSGSSFKSPFNLDSKLAFFDLSGKTSRVQSFSPDNVEERFRAPEPPRFQDIYGLDSGESPLRRSGYGNTIGPSKGSSFSRLFFQDEGIRDTLNVGLTPEEMDIPRESGEEESSTSFHEDRAVDEDPGYEDTVGNPDDAVSGQEDYYYQDDSSSGVDGSPSVNSSPSEYENGDPSLAGYADGDSSLSGYDDADSSLSGYEAGDPNQAALAPSDLNEGYDNSLRNLQDGHDDGYKQDLQTPQTYGDQAEDVEEGYGGGAGGTDPVGDTPTA